MGMEEKYRGQTNKSIIYLQVKFKDKTPLNNEYYKY
jgi:hypothetical protein